MKQKTVSPLLFLLILFLVSAISIFITLLLPRFHSSNMDQQSTSNENETILVKNGNAYCDKDLPYSMAPEFDRVLSLINQRFTKNSGLEPLSNIVLVTRNCINIQYRPDSEMSDAEGIFTFSDTSTRNNLQIFVSNRYKSTDDLLTATLLVHELSHAFHYALNKGYSCYGDEARAFANQYIFLSNALNSEEKQSLISRYNNNPSPEVKNMMNLVLTINSYSGNTINQQAENMVRESKYYQEECGE